MDSQTLSCNTKLTNIMEEFKHVLTSQADVMQMAMMMGLNSEEKIEFRRLWNTTDLTEKYVQKALSFAAEKHRDQIRKVSKLPYIIHPMSVALFLYEFGIQRREMICAAILHDVLEDTDATVEDIKVEFGNVVAKLVNELTTDKNDIKLFAGKNEYLIRNMAEYMSGRALTIKLCDRLSNVSDNPTEKYVADTKIMMQRLPLERIWALTPTHDKIIDKINNKIIQIMNDKKRKTRNPNPNYK